MHKFQDVKEVRFVKEEAGRDHNLTPEVGYLILDREPNNRVLIADDDGNDISVSADCFVPDMEPVEDFALTLESIMNGDIGVSAGEYFAARGWEVTGLDIGEVEIKTNNGTYRLSISIVDEA